MELSARLVVCDSGLRFQVTVRAKMAFKSVLCYEVGLCKALLDISPTGFCLAADISERVGYFRMSRMNLRGVRLHGFNRIKHRRQGIIFNTDQTQRLFSSVPVYCRATAATSSPMCRTLSIAKAS